MTAFGRVPVTPARASARKMSARVRLLAPTPRRADAEEAAAGDAVAQAVFLAEESQHGGTSPFTEAGGKAGPAEDGRWWDSGPRGAAQSFSHLLP